MVKKRKISKIDTTIGSKLRIRLPNDYMGMFPHLTAYDSNKILNIKKWTIEQAQNVRVLNHDSNYVQPDIIKTAQKIYDWVMK